MANADGRRFQGNNLTQRCVDAAVARSIEYTLWDCKVPGFGLRVRITGHRAFVYLYKRRGDNKRWTIGKPGALTLEQARTEARLLAGAVARGDDPAAAKARQKGATLKIVYEQYEKQHLAKQRLSTSAWTRRIFRAELIPALGKAPVASIVRSDIRVLTNTISERGARSVANSVHRAASAFLTWCVHEEIIAVNPIYGTPQPNRHSYRHRSLDKQEVVYVWNASGTLRAPWRDAVRLLILLGQRKNELLQARFAEFDLDARTWVIPATRTKNHREHTVHLCPLALDILKAMQRSPGQTFLFQSPRDPSRPLSGLNARVDESLLLAKIPGWCIHDLRRTTATHMAALQVSPHVIEVVLNHRSGFRAGVAGIYNHHAYSEESREAWRLWGDTLSTWIEESGGKLVLPARYDDSVEL